VFCLLFSSASFASDIDQDQLERKKINAGIQEIIDTRNNKLSSSAESLRAVLNNTKSSNLEIESARKEHEELSDRLYIEMLGNMETYLEEMGYYKVGYEVDECGNIIEDRFDPLSISSDITVTQHAYANPGNPNQFYYYNTWRWKNLIPYDSLWDTYDILSAQIRYDNGWRWTEMTVSTYDNWGNRTGRTDGNTHTGNGVTLRNDFWNGKAYNIYDLSTWSQADVQTYKTKEMLLDGWIQAGSTSSNQVKSNFEHNWKESSLNLSANISQVSLSGFALNVSYSRVNKSWQRGSNALVINKP
jgi:hypothetical protein